MRTPCWDCTFKHLAEAYAYDAEYSLGYPRFSLGIVGSLSHASMECAGYHLELANLIREHRLRWMADHQYAVPYEALGAYVELCANMTAPYPAIPDECAVPDSTTVAP